MIQSNHMLLEWKAALPGVQFDYLALMECSQPLTGLPLRNVFLIPSLQWREMEEDLAAGRFSLAEERGRAILHNLPLGEYRHILNVDFSYASCWFNRHIPAASHAGGRLDANHRRIYDDWGYFFRAAGKYQNASQINLVDVFRSVVHTGIIPGADARPPLAAASSLPFELPDGRRVALNPGANEIWRRWPARGFIELAGRLRDAGFTPLLVGSPGDRELCGEIAGACPFPLPDFSGRTSVPEMVTLLRQSELLISNDTGAVHLAAAAGTPVLGLYERIPYFFITAPWSARNLVLYCPNASVTLPPSLVGAAALERLGCLDQQALRAQLDAEGVEGWETSFLPRGADPLGGLVYLPLHRHPQPPARLLGYVLRHLLARQLCGGNGLVSFDCLREQIQTGAIPLAPQGAAAWEQLGALVQDFIDRLEALAVCAGRACAAAGRDDTAEMRRQAGLLAAGMSAMPAAPSDCPPLQLLLAWLSETLKGCQDLPLPQILQVHQQECQRIAGLLAEALPVTLQLAQASLQAHA